jgi:hypothetical protein
LRHLGLHHVTATRLTAVGHYRDFDDFWDPFTFAVGPAGQYLRSLEAEQQTAVRERCERALPTGPFQLAARAWCARGTVPAAD